MKLQFKTATEKDIPTIYHLADKIWKIHYTPIIGKEQVDYMLEKMYSEESLLAQMDAGHEFTLVKNDDEYLGYASVSFRDGDYILHKIYVLADQHAKGIGTTLMNYLFQTYSHGNRMELTVNRQNFKAINFYFKHGFTIQSVEDFDIGEGYFMNDFVMTKKLKP